MNDKEINILQRLFKGKIQLSYNPDSTTCFQVRSIGTHAEEGGELCAIFTNGKYAALYNARLSDFVVTERLGVC